MKIQTVVFLATALCVPLPVQSQETNTLVLTRTIALPDVQGGFNHMSVDAEHQWLFAAAPTDHILEIIDLSSGHVWRSLAGERPTAARFAPEFNQLYVPRGQSVHIYDGKTFELITRIDLQSILDELQYDPRARQLYVGCMSPGKTGIAVIAIPEGKFLGKIPLPAKPQGIAVEQEGKRIFANVPSLKQVAVVDRDRRALLHPWQLQDVQGNTPMALDEAHRRLFIGARRPPRLVVLDTLTGKPVAEVAIDGFADDLFYDPIRQRIYISCGEGFIDVIEQHDAGHYRLLTRLPTAEDAATSAFSAQLKSLYLGVPRIGNHPAEIRIFKIGN